jgi:hypothetical protein
MLKKIHGGYPPAELPEDPGDISLLWSLLNSCWALEPLNRPKIEDIHAWLWYNNAKILLALQDAR